MPGGGDAPGAAVPKERWSRRSGAGRGGAGVGRCGAVAPQRSSRAPAESRLGAFALGAGSGPV